MLPPFDTKELSELRPRHDQTMLIGEIVHVQTKNPTFLQVNQLSKSPIEMIGLYVESEAYQLALALFHLEPDVVDKIRIEQAD